MDQLQGCTCAYYWKPFSQRTFFVINSDAAWTTPHGQSGPGATVRFLSLTVLLSVLTGCASSVTAHVSSNFLLEITSYFVNRLRYLSNSSLSSNAMVPSAIAPIPLKK